MSKADAILLLNKIDGKNNTARQSEPEQNAKAQESEKEKDTGRVEGKSRVTMREKENTGNCPFENIGFYLGILGNAENPHKYWF